MISDSNILRSFYIDGESSADYGLLITGEAVWDAAAYDYEFVQIPGRSGDLVLDNGRFNNITVTYPCVLRDLSKMCAVRSWLMSKRGYCRITDDYNPSEFRMGVVIDGLSVDPFNAKAGRFTVSFNCKPQRYLATADREQQFTLMALDSAAHEYVSKDFPVFGSAVLYDEQWKSGMTAAEWMPALKRVVIDGSNVFTRAQCAAVLDLTTGSVDLYALNGGVAATMVSVVIDHSGLYAAGYMTLFRYETSSRDPYYSGTHLPIYNPTPYTAKPSIRFFADNTNGTDQKFVFGESYAGIEIEMNEYLEDEDCKFIIDSEMYQAYIIDSSGNILNGDQYVTAIGGAVILPEFEPGQNYVHAYLLTDNTMAATVYAYVTPRFFRI